MFWTVILALGLQTACGDSATGPSPTEGVTVYQHPNYRGDDHMFGRDNENLDGLRGPCVAADDPEGGGSWHHCVSSIRIAEGGRPPYSSAMISRAKRSPSQPTSRISRTKRDRGRAAAIGTTASHRYGCLKSTEPRATPRMGVRQHLFAPGNRGFRGSRQRLAGRESSRPWPARLGTFVDGVPESATKREAVCVHDPCIRHVFFVGSGGHSDRCCFFSLPCRP